MGMMIKSGMDVVSFLKEQHVQVKGLFASVMAARGEERKRAFVALRRTLAVHETAEEEIVHPAAKRILPDGETVIAARLKEENEAKKALTIERMKSGVRVLKGVPGERQLFAANPL